MANRVFLLHPKRCAVRHTNAKKKYGHLLKQKYNKSKLIAASKYVKMRISRSCIKVENVGVA